MGACAGLSVCVIISFAFIRRIAGEAEQTRRFCCSDVTAVRVTQLHITYLPCACRRGFGTEACSGVLLAVLRVGLPTSCTCMTTTARSRSADTDFLFLIGKVRPLDAIGSQQICCWLFRVRALSIGQVAQRTSPADIYGTPDWDANKTGLFFQLICVS